MMKANQNSGMLGVELDDEGFAVEDSGSGEREPPPVNGDAATGDRLQQYASDVILPEAMRPGINQLLEQCGDNDMFSQDDLLSIVFIIRIIEALHACFYASFLSLSLAEMLKRKLGVPQLELEDIEVYACRWSVNGLVSFNHRISWDFDMAAAYELTEIARKVLV